MPILSRLWLLGCFCAGVMCVAACPSTTHTIESSEEDRNPATDSNVDSAISAVANIPPASPEEFNPQLVIRATNQVGALGLDGAVDALRAYLHSRKADSRELFSSGANAKVLLLFYSTFAPSSPYAQLPDCYLGNYGTLIGTAKDAYGRGPLVIVHGIPFYVSLGVAIAGSPDSAVEFLSYARLGCSVSRVAMIPTSGPLVAAARLMELIDGCGFAAAESQGLKWRVAIQAATALTHLEPCVEWRRALLDTRNAPDRFQAVWTQFCADEARIAIEWDGAQQRFRCKD